jgi:hypothetical protein
MILKDLAITEKLGDQAELATALAGSGKCD